nr:hypothetical protein [uncultured Caproiciproducens sp.]
MGDAGKPTVAVHILPGTPEEVARNRENLRYVTEQICSEKNGCATKVTIDWDSDCTGKLFDRKGRVP